MKIGGLQKLTLLDYPGKMACIIFTAGCNFRCPFCHNASLVTHIEEEISESEVLAFLEKRKKILDGVVITGGEPLLYDLEPFIRAIKEKGYLVKLDTNGSFPDRLKALVKKGLIDYVAMDIKNSPDKYALTAGASVDLEKIKESVEFLKSDAVDYEFRTTVVKPFFEKSDFTAIGEWIKGAKRYFIQSFTDSGDLVGAQQMSAYDKDEENEFLLEVQRSVPTATMRERK